MTFLLVTTIREAELGGPRLAPLLESLTTQALPAPATLLVVVRESRIEGVTEEDVPGAHVVWRRIADAVGLSRARNVGLEHARAAGLLDAADFVHFADDDQRFPPATLARVESLFASHPEIDVLIGAYGPSVEAVDRQRWPARPGPLSIWDTQARVASATSYYRTACVSAVGAFDERFGLGARFGAGEDVDFALRALGAGAVARYEPDVVVLHPYVTGSLARSFPGNVALTVKHVFRRKEGVRLLSRVLKHGYWLQRDGSMSRGVFLRGLAAGAESLVRCAFGPA